jgi:hypothetical protein
MSESSPSPDLRKPIVPPILLGIGSVLWRLIDWAGRIDFVLRVQNQSFAVIFQAFVDYGWLLVVVGCAAWTYYARKQPAPAEGYRIPWSMVVSVSFLTFLYGVLLAVYATGSVPTVLVAWGPNATGCQFGVDTSRLSSFKDSYYLVGVCGLSDPSIDVLQQTGITISTPFTITSGGVNIFAPYSPTMLAAVKNTVTNIPNTMNINMWYQPVLVPKDSDLSKVTRLLDVKKAGGKILSPALFE